MCLCVKCFLEMWRQLLQKVFICMYLMDIFVNLQTPSKLLKDNIQKAAVGKYFRGCDPKLVS